jgi:hypothetical protein
MARYQCRKEAALARLRPKPTPKSEERIVRAQYRIDQAEERAQMDELEALKAEVEKSKPEKKKVTKPVPKAKPVRKPKVEEKINYGEHGHDFNSEED